MTVQRLNSIVWHIIHFVNTFNMTNRQNVTSLKQIILLVILHLSKIVKKPPRGGEERNIFLDCYSLTQMQTRKKLLSTCVIFTYFKSFYFNTNDQLSNEIKQIRQVTIWKLIVLLKKNIQQCMYSYLPVKNEFTS